MKISGKIIDKINEAVNDVQESDYKAFNKQIALLIADEKEAIEGYEKALEILTGRMTNAQYNEIKRELDHIIQEEREHIEELESLKSKIDK